MDGRKRLEINTYVLYQLPNGRYESAIVTRVNEDGTYDVVVVDKDLHYVGRASTELQGFAGGWQHELKIAAGG